MGKKPVSAIVSALCVGLALTGCQHCSSCKSDSAGLAKANQPATFMPQPKFQTNSAAAAPATAMGWNNSGTPPKASSPYAPTPPAAVGMDKPAAKPVDAVATSTPASSGVQPAGLDTTAPPGAAAPVDANTSHFPPSSTGRILPTPPSLTTGATLPPLEDQNPFPTRAEPSTTAALPPPLPPPPPPMSLAHTPSSDGPPLPDAPLPSSAPHSPSRDATPPPVSAPHSPSSGATPTPAGMLPAPPPPPGPNG